MAVTKEEIFEKLQSALNETFEIAPEKITREARLMEDLEIDSIDAIDLLVQLKPLLGKRKIDPSYFYKMRTVGDVVDGLKPIKPICSSGYCRLF